MTSGKTLRQTARGDRGRGSSRSASRPRKPPAVSACIRLSVAGVVSALAVLGLSLVACRPAIETVARRLEGRNLVSVPIELDKVAASVDAPFACVAGGTFIAGIESERPEPVGHNFSPAFGLRVSVVGQSKTLIAKDIDEPLYSYWSGTSSNRRGGVALFRFRAPKDVPVRETLRLSVHVIRPDADFARRYGPTVLTVWREGDW